MNFYCSYKRIFAMRISLCRAAALIACSGMVALMGGGIASARMSGPQTFTPTQGLIYDLGSKRAIGYFLNAGGTCQVTLMIAEAVDPDVAQPPSAAQMKVG